MAALGSCAREQPPHSLQAGGVARTNREVEAYLIDLAIVVGYGEVDNKKSFEE